MNYYMVQLRGNRPESSYKQWFDYKDEKDKVPKYHSLKLAKRLAYNVLFGYSSDGGYDVRVIKRTDVAVRLLREGDDEDSLSDEIWGKNYDNKQKPAQG